jgi:hypothetical protein
MNNIKIKITTNKLEYHKAIIDILKENKIEFHTYPPRQQRAYRVAIRNLHHSVQQESVREWGTKLETYGRADTGTLATPCHSSS